MNKGNKYGWHIFFILMYIAFGVLLVVAIRSSFAIHDSWICAGVSVAEKGVTQEEIDFCTSLGKYYPSATVPKLQGASFLLSIALHFLTIFISLVALGITGIKHYKILICTPHHQKL